MNISETLRRVQFVAIILTPFALALLFVAYFIGCQSKPEAVKEAKPTVTLENLQTAYAKQIRYRDMYELFVKQAEKEKNRPMAALYRAAARSEAIHADLHARLLRANGLEPITPAPEQVVVGTVLQTLKMATSSEEIEFSSMYPNLIRSAEAEKFAEASTQFDQIRSADERHNELFQDALSRNGKPLSAQYFVCPGCGYILDSPKTEECPVCKTPKDRFEKI
jgi:rubrerythrin